MEGVDHQGVKVHLDPGMDVAQDFLHRPGLLVRSAHAQGIEHIGQRHDAGGLGDLLPAQATRVAAAVPFLVVPQRDLGGELEHRGLALAQDVIANLRMGAHDFPFGLIQQPRFAQNRLRHAQLAGVVHGGGQFQAGAAGGIPATGLGQHAGISPHAPDVGPGVGVVVVPGVAQHQNCVAVALFQCRGPHPRQMCRDPRQHDRRGHRLGDVVHRTRRKARSLVCRVGIAGHKDHLHVLGGIALFDLSAQVVAVGVGQSDIEQHQRRAVLDHRCQRLGPIAGKRQHIGFLQDLAHDGQVGGFVVDDQNGGNVHGLLLGQNAVLPGQLAAAGLGPPKVKSLHTGPDGGQVLCRQLLCQPGQ